MYALKMTKGTRLVVGANLKSYMEYYNLYHPHQGLNSIPEGRPPDFSGKIKPVLYGLNHHYYLMLKSCKTAIDRKLYNNIHHLFLI